MITLMNLPIRRGNAPLRIARGHFATNHSHINYFVDITYQKTRLSEAKDSAHQLVSHFINDTPAVGTPWPWSLTALRCWVRVWPRS